MFSPALCLAPHFSAGLNIDVLIILTVLTDDSYFFSFPHFAPHSAMLTGARCRRIDNKNK